MPFLDQDLIGRPTRLGAVRLLASDARAASAAADGTGVDDGLSSRASPRMGIRGLAVVWAAAL